METEQHIERRATPLAHKKSHGKFIALLVVLAILLAAGIAAGLLKRQTHDRALAATAEDDAGRAPVVNVGHVRRAGAKSTIELPGDLVARVETPMYARVDGYLKQRPVDIGDRVKKGDLLVEIDAPDLDAQIAMSEGHALAIEGDAPATQRRASRRQEQCQTRGPDRGTI